MLPLTEKELIINKTTKLLKKIKSFSTIRFILAILIIIFGICFLSLNLDIIYLILAIAILTVLIGFIIMTNPFYNELKSLRNLELVIKKHENRRNLTYSSFTPDGREYVNYDDYKVLDLDLLGPRSLYQYLCVAKSSLGKEKLAKQLTEPVKKEEKFSKCVKTLAEDNNYFHLEAAIFSSSAEAKECKNEEILGITSKKIKISSLGLSLMVLSYLALVVATILLVLNGLPLYYLLFFIPLNFIIARKFSNNEVYALNATKYANLFTSYLELEKALEKIDIKDPYYNELKSILKNQLPNLVKFKKLFEMLSYRKNIIFSIIANGIIYADYILALHFNLTTRKMESIEDSLEAIAELELVLSLATIGVDNECYSIPLAGDHLAIKDGYHPLVKNCVSNDLELNGGTILTGSNMSGKTTFMRMIGINQVLANAGGLVCAKEFVTNDFIVLTSLRANDMLQEGISTFYAEIKRMKKIVEISKGDNVLVLVDEIFKGTNAKDRIYASFEIIKKLNSFNANFIITTHDFELCEAKNIVNYHFDEEYQNDLIYFDYKIKEGKCNKTNALYLLRMAGVLEDN